MPTQEQIAHDLAVIVAHTYIDDETKRGEYREGGVEAATQDALSVYNQAYALIIRNK